MIQKDYVLRQIQQLVQVMAYVLQLKREGKQEEVRAEIDHALQETLGTRMKDLLELGKSELITLCSPNGEFSADMALVLAELLEEEGKMSDISEESTIAQKCFQRALELYEAMVSFGEAVPIDVHDRITRLR